MPLNMKLTTSLVIALIVFGAAAIWHGSSRSAVRNQEPINLPYPGAGFSVSGPFRLASGGRFALEVSTPATAGEIKLLHREQPDVICDLNVTLAGDRQFRISRHITVLHNGGWSGDEDLFFPPEPFEFPTGGDYELTLKSNIVTDRFSTRGAVVRLERWEDVGSAIGWAIEVWAGYSSLACALLFTILLRFKLGLKPAA